MSWLLPPLPPTFDAALRDVRARGFEARLAAAERLADPEPGRESEALDGLIVMSRDLNGRVRAAALRGLDGHEDLRVTDLLIAALEDGEPLVREVAVVGLGSVDSERARQALIEALGSDHAEVRFQAIESYLEAAGEPQLGAIAPLLSDTDARVRENAALNLHRLGEAAREPLREALDDPSPRVRQRAAISLGTLGDSAAVPALCEALGDPELLVAALDLLGGLGEPRAVAPVAAIATAFLKPLPLKVAAARALCRLGDPRGLAALFSVLRALRGDGRSYAVEVIGELGLQELAGELLRLSRRLRGTDPVTLVEALIALGPGSEPARSALQTLARRRDPAGERAREALGDEPEKP
ncbi:MAG: HEAT repeat domain-containing protein [Myxococcales bacterium]|nr:HEAT repeat domain-containing protein [Myxococcales bacterium]